MIETIQVDLTLSPEERWQGLRPFRHEMEDLFQTHLADLGRESFTSHREMLKEYRRSVISPEFNRELDWVASLSGKDSDEVMILNLYYDAIKLLLGCSAFAFEHISGPMHARNLDWYSPGNLLQKYTRQVNFLGAPAGEFTAVSWPGFIGVLSGFAPGRFAVTLNAVLSNEAAAIARPITFLLREVLETARNFEEALEALCETEIFSDCILLLTGVNRGEIRVIERTPTKYKIREPRNGYISATNHYRAFQIEPLYGAGLASEEPGQLRETSCNRLDRIDEVFAGQAPANPEDCFTLLNDEEVRMDITMQRMVFQASTGLIDVRY